MTAFRQLRNINSFVDLLLHFCDIFDEVFDVEKRGEFGVASLHGEELLSLNNHNFEFWYQVHKMCYLTGIWRLHFSHSFFRFNDEIVGLFVLDFDDAPLDGRWQFVRKGQPHFFNLLDLNNIKNIFNFGQLLKHTSFIKHFLVHLLDRQFFLGEQQSSHEDLPIVQLILGIFSELC